MSSRDGCLTSRTILIIYFLAFGVIALFVITSTNMAPHDTVYVDGEPVKILGASQSKIPSLYHYLDLPDTKTFKWTADYTPYQEDSGYSLYKMDLTSLKWLTDADVNLSTWKHRVTIIRPKDMTPSPNASIYISRCDNQEGQEACWASELKRAMDFSLGSKLLTAVLYTIPNQNMLFPLQPEKLELSEDAMISFTWEMYMTKYTDRPDWIAYFPMVKSVLRCMDAVEAWSTEMVKQKNMDKAVGKWYPWGLSKRGGTTWLLSAYMGTRYPNRIIGSAPIVYDVLNFKKVVMDSMPTKLGGFASSFKPYSNCFDSFVNNQTASDALVKQVDASVEWYQDGLARVSKLAINSAMDEFFLMGNDRFWFETIQKPNPKHFHRLLVPTANHSFHQGGEWLTAALVSHVIGLIGGNGVAALPVVEGTVDHVKHTIQLCADQKPTKSQLWYASPNPTIPQRIDYRMTKPVIEGGCLPPAVVQGQTCMSIAQWATPIELEIGQKEGKWCSSFQHDGSSPDPIQWTSYYIISTWNKDGAIGGGLTYNSPILITPDALPFPNSSCIGPKGPETCPVGVWV
jgi:PhoPQ-activated pathogenicity-related protein